MSVNQFKTALNLKKGCLLLRGVRIIKAGIIII